MEKIKIAAIQMSTVADKMENLNTVVGQNVLNY